MNTRRTLPAASLGLVALVGFVVMPAHPSHPRPDPAAAVAAPARDWTLFGGDPSRNMVNLREKHLPATWEVDREKGRQNVRWVARLGSRAYGVPVISGGKIFCGTNNERPRNSRDRGKQYGENDVPFDKGVLMCFRESDGTFLWQAVHDKLASGQVNDWPREGIASSPAVEGERLYYVSNRCELVCADTEGFANGNQGVRDEKYRDASDADVIWRLDMIEKLGVFPHNLAACHPLVVGELVFVCTGNGVDENHITLPAPEAPSFVAVNKRNGQIVWTDSSPGRNVMHGQWAHPAYSEVGRPQVIFPGGDGWLRAFDPPTGKLLWKFDGNPKDSRYELGGTGTRSDFVCAPAIHDGRLYIATGQDPEHFSGVGHLWCIDLAKAVERGAIHPERDVSPVNNNFDPETNENERLSALVWHFGGADPNPKAQRDFIFGRSLSTCCVHEGVVYATELAGYVHCLDAKTGRRFWQYDLKAAVWGSPYLAAGKVYVPTENGDVFVFRHTKEQTTFREGLIEGREPDLKAARKKRLEVRKAIEKAHLIGMIEMDAPIRVPPVAANGVLYMMTEKDLYAISSRAQ